MTCWTMGPLIPFLLLGLALGTQEIPAGEKTGPGS